MDWVMAGETLDVDPETFSETVRAARAFLVPRWTAWHAERRALDLRIAAIDPAVPARPMPEPPSRGMATFSAAFLCRALNRDFGHRWRVACGEVASSDGPVRHAWSTHRSVVLDLTAERFGGKDVVLATAGDPVYRHRARSLPLGALLGDHARRVERWLAEWRELRSSLGRSG